MRKVKIEKSPSSKAFNKRANWDHDTEHAHNLLELKLNEIIHTFLLFWKYFSETLYFTTFITHSV